MARRLRPVRARPLASCSKTKAILLVDHASKLREANEILLAVVRPSRGAAPTLIPRQPLEAIAARPRPRRRAQERLQQAPRLS
jgi:hypothetical protein